jgi:hypothetical protein
MESNSLMHNIIKEFGQEIGNKIQRRIAFESNLFILYLVDIHEVTRMDLEIGFASYHARYPERTFEDYIKFKRNWDQDKYTFDIEPQGYFIDRATAVDYAKCNMGDINEAGAYPYVVISSMPLHCVYPHANIREHTLFHFNKDTEKYDEIDWDYNDGTKCLERHINSMVV